MLWNKAAGTDSNKQGENSMMGWTGFLIFPIVFLYDEMVFKWFEKIVQGNWLVLMLSVLAAGSLAGVIYLLFRGQLSRLIYTELVLSGMGVLFIVESFVGNAFQVFMPLDSLTAGAGDVAGGFAGNVLDTLVHGWYLLVLYMIPPALIWMLRKHLICDQRVPISFPVLAGIAAVDCFLAASRLASSVPVYQDNYQFDLAIRTFGLLQTLRLETEYNLLGKDAEDYMFADGEMYRAGLDEHNSSVANESIDNWGMENGSNDSTGNQKLISQWADSNADNIGDSTGEEYFTEKNIDLTENRKYDAAKSSSIQQAFTSQIRHELPVSFQQLAMAEQETSLKNLSTWIAGQQGSNVNAYTGLFQGKNLILICAEAFSPYVISPELTPALYRLQHNGFYFSDYYQPAWGGSTSTGEYAVLMGLIPTDGVKSIRETEEHNLFLTIGNQLKSEGYYTAAYHNNSYTYYDRDKTHVNMGYETFTGMGNGMEQGVEKNWPESDLEMINYTVPQFISKQPFCIYYMTVSGHCGYSFSGNDMSEKNQQTVQKLNASDTIKAYVAAQLELEYAVESLLYQLEQAGIADDTVICLTSDHYPYGLEKGDTWGNQENYLPELYGLEEAGIDQFVRDKSVWILWSGSMENAVRGEPMRGTGYTEASDEIAAANIKTVVPDRTVTAPVSSLDILPTLSNLFGVSYDSRLFAGRDVFSEIEPLVIWPDYSWKTDQACYNARNGRVSYAENTGISSAERKSYEERIKTLVKNKFQLSKITLNYDYWDRLSE